MTQKRMIGGKCEGMSELRLRLLVAKRASGSYLLAAYQNYIPGGSLII